MMGALTIHSDDLGILEAILLEDEFSLGVVVVLALSALLASLS